MSKEELIKLLKGLLKTDDELDFLLELNEEDIKRLIITVNNE
jgi:hypothetical protein